MLNTFRAINSERSISTEGNNGTCRGHSLNNKVSVNGYRPTLRSAVKTDRAADRLWLCSSLVEMTDRTRDGT
jgi:hypothetical protein